MGGVIGVCEGKAAGVSAAGLGSPPISVPTSSKVTNTIMATAAPENSNRKSSRKRHGSQPTAFLLAQSLAAAVSS